MVKFKIPSTWFISLTKRKIQVSSEATDGINFSFVLLCTTFDRFQHNFIFLQDNFGKGDQTKELKSKVNLYVRK